MNTIRNSVDATMTTVIRGYHRLTKTPINTREQIDTMLDAILDYRHLMENRTEEIRRINELVQKLTWTSDPPNEADMEALEIIIDSCTHMLNDFLIKEKTFLESSELLKHLPTAIDSFLEEVENLEENIDDLREIFFVIPQDKEFQKLNQQLRDR